MFTNIQPGVQYAQTGYQQPQQQILSVTAQSNAQRAIQFIMNTLVSWYQMGSAGISQYEYSATYNILGNPATLSSIAADLQRIYGDINLSDATLQEYATNWLRSSLDSQRIQRMPQQQIFSQGFNPGGYQQYMRPYQGYQGYQGYQQPMPQRSPQEEFYDKVYSNNTDNAAPNMSPRPAPLQRQAPVVNQQHPPVQATVRQDAQKHTGKVMDLSELNNTRDVVTQPKWEAKNNNWEFWSPTKGSEKIVTVGQKWYEICCEKQKIKNAEIRIEQPVTNVAEVAAEVITNVPKLVDGTFCHLIDYDQMNVTRQTFPAAKQHMDKIIEIVKSKDVGDGVIEVLKALKSAGEDFGGTIGGLLLDRFNNAASVNFLKHSATGVTRLPRLTRLQELGWLLTDTDKGENNFEAWKQDDASFKNAILNTLRYSFNAIFRVGRVNYLDPEKAEDSIHILTDARTGFIFSNGMTGKMLAYAQDADALKDEVSDKLNEVFELVTGNKVLLHNLDLPVDTSQIHFRVVMLQDTTATRILQKVYETYGNVELIDINDPTQYNHPYLLGMTYHGELVIRRI